MPKHKHTNAASRLHTALTSALSTKDQATYLALAEVFRVKGPDDRRTAELVLARLHWFFAELELLEAQVRSTGMSDHLYEGAFSRIRKVFSPVNFGAPWQGVKGNLTPEVLLSLAFCSELLPDEESEIDGEELAAIAAEVSELEALLAKSTLTEPVRRLIEHHLQLIRQALAQYPIQGAKALREARRTAIGEIVETEGAIVVPPDSEERSRLVKVWKRISDAADIALKAERIGQLAHKTVEALLSLPQLPQ